MLEKKVHDYNYKYAHNYIFDVYNKPNRLKIG